MNRTTDIILHAGHEVRCSILAMHPLRGPAAQQQVREGLRRPLSLCACASSYAQAYLRSCMHVHARACLVSAEAQAEHRAWH